MIRPAVTYDESAKPVGLFPTQRFQGNQLWSPQLRRRTETPFPTGAAPSSNLHERGFEPKAATA